ncbi:MAG: phosphoethanolamine transferase [Acidaminococcus sp.]|jgi:heptose-I-phosphate ethanolaminephosphotransferase|nr:phosphoethanolamine transferase [Acidaminococcus sp.]MCI2115383.1 phosphoethanolamine transferase [Acidaminococcus sp.]MCI2117479.1 phosphoethanolamine transferase [Acidaminococcus sp.]
MNQHISSITESYHSRIAPLLTVLVTFCCELAFLYILCFYLMGAVAFTHKRILEIAVLWCGFSFLLGNPKKFSLIGGILLLIYTLPLLVLKQNPASYIPSNRILGTAASAFYLWGCTLLLQTAALTFNRLSKVLSKALSLLAGAVFAFALVLPLPELFYLIVSRGKRLSADIILTLFQTNAEEAAAYLASQPLWLWGTALLITIVLTVFAFKLFIWQERHLHPLETTRQKAAFLLLCGLTLPLNSQLRHDSFIVQCKETRQVLADYKHYGKAKAKRMKRLEEMSELSIRSNARGLYVLVIGESATRDHMHAYGYERETTPFLDTLKKQQKAILYDNVYSNHTHTVPSLTYALSEKNQYNDVPLAKACSILETAKAAGYETYWISNQRKYSAWDTPTAEIASTADHQIWINGHAGEGMESSFYDKELLKYLPKTSETKPVLVIFHIMGSHATYQNRYPEAFAHFKGKDKLVDEYDNSIRYTDSFLCDLYKAISSRKEFQAFIYMPDHGEDPDEKKSHEASKFTPEMSHIPLVVSLSPNFLSHRSTEAEILKEHRHACWTNDLLYNLMLSLLGIENAPCVEDHLDLAQPAYSLDKDQVLLLHGKRQLSR